jgi:hypothetical protein
LRGAIKRKMKLKEGIKLMVDVLTKKGCLKGKMRRPLSDLKDKIYKPTSVRFLK